MNGRDRHLFGPGPKRILAIDGGGVRGIMALAFLDRIERLLAERTGRGAAFRLSDYFDLIGGTSTGAIIAAGLALGHSVDDLKRFYLDLAPRVFRRSVLRMAGFQAKFDSKPLMSAIHRQVGDVTLGDPEIRTGLAITTKRLDTGSAWVLVNNPRGLYWEDPPDGSYVGNRHYRLDQVIRASTAAPYYFAPEAK